MFSAVRNLPPFRPTRARATSSHLLYLNHVAVCPIDREQYCFPVLRPNQSCPELLPSQRRAGQFERRQQNVRSPRTRPQALCKSLESCRPRYAALSRPVRPRAFHLGSSLRDKLQIPRRDCSRRFRSLAVLTAPPATPRSLL